MRLVTASLAVLSMVPVVLLVAVAAGPVALAFLCAGGFGLIVFVLEGTACGVAVVGLSVEHAVARHLHRAAR
jgi:uncharacterized membrane protein YwaF